VRVALAEGGILRLFLADLFHQILFYFGGVVAMLILLWEKWKKKSIQWRWVAAFFLFCLFVSCFQAWIDEHHNAEILIEQKAAKTSEVIVLSAKLESKQVEVDWLRDHRDIQVNAAAPDPVLARAMETNARALASLTDREQNRELNLKKRTIELSNTMLNFISNETRKEGALWSMDMPMTNDQWREREAKALQAEEVIQGEVRSRYIREFQPDVLAIFQQISSDGEEATGVKESDIVRAKEYCEFSTNMIVIGRCATDVGVIGRNLRPH
jgi:hypothetical protein